MIHQIDSKNEQLLISGRFTAKFKFVLTLKLGKVLFQWFHFKDNRKGQRFFQKTVLGIFKRTLHLREHVFMRQLLEIWDLSNNLTLNKIFWKTETILKKLEYRISVESIQNRIISIQNCHIKSQG